MAMNNTYTRQVQAAPADLNPHQNYVEEYDAMNELVQNAVTTGQNILNTYAKARDDNERETTKLLVDERNEKLKNAMREVQLNQDPATWEENYKQRFDEIDEEYKGQVPARYTDEYNRWNELNDSRNLMDLRFAQTKKTQEINRELLFDRVERNAKNAIGADAGTIAMLDADTKNSLAGALKRGQISRLQYDKAMRNYGESKTYNALSDRLIRDPEGLKLDLEKNAYGLNAKDLKSWKSKVDHELKINDLTNKTAENNQIEAQALTAMEMIKNKQQPPQTLLDQLPEKTREAMQKVQFYAVTGDDVPTDTQTYGFLNDMRQNYPERFKNLNLYDYAGSLSGEDLQALRYAQQSIVIGLDGKAKVNPTISHNDQVLKVAHNSLGFKQNSQEAYDFDRLYDGEVRAIINEKGRMPTQTEQDDIIKRLRKSVATRRDWWFDGDKEARTLEEDDRPYVEMKDIAPNTKEAILNIIKNDKNFNTLLKLNDEEQDQMVEEMAGVYERPKEQWKDATRNVINRYLDIASRRK